MASSEQQSVAQALPTQVSDPIQHVVLLILENHSFDQMLGCFKKLYLDLEGIDPNLPRANKDTSGNEYLQLETKELQMRYDPNHETNAVLKQLANGNSGFIQNFVENYPESTSEDRQNIMGYYPLDFLPALHQLAREFTICDQWFSSLPGPTWPNRFFALSGTCSGRVRMPNGAMHPDLANALIDQHQITLFDRLNEQSIPWKVYYYDFPSSLVLTHQRHPINLSRYHKIEQFFEDARNTAEMFPAFSFIEPKYFGLDQNDNHPPHNLMKAEKLVADVYNAIRSNDELWNKSLLVVMFDEHGGFYDHVSPPSATPPDHHTDEYTFDRLGVRVPALLISPWVDRRVEHTQFDHTSLLKYLIEKWSLGPLGNRTAIANSIKPGICLKAPREDTIPFIRVPYSYLISPHPEFEKEASNNHHEALHVFADLLQKEMDQGMTSTLEEITKVDNSWVKFKAAIGSKLIRLGTCLGKDLADYKEDRTRRTTAVVDRLMKTSV